MSNPITIEEFKSAMPAHMKGKIDLQVIDDINNAIKDPEALLVYRENIIGMSSLLKDGKFKLESYVNAVKYVSHKLLGDNQVTAFTKTFPERFN
jgi:hypothetical protein